MALDSVPFAAVRAGDFVRFTLPIWQGGSFYRGRSSGKPRIVGHTTYAGVVERHSYGGEKGQHTFSIRLQEPLVDAGKLKLVKGRNLYPNLTEHVVS